MTLTQVLTTTENSLADSFGRAGFLTVMPDLFQGKPAPEDINGTPNFNVTQFLNDHRPEITDPIIASTIRHMRETLKVDKIAVTGYCFGGRYSFRFIAEGKGADVGFAAHPSLLQDAEVTAIAKPVSLACARKPLPISPRLSCGPQALDKKSLNPLTHVLYRPPLETDDLFPAARRHAVEDLLFASGQQVSVATYGGTQHGFGVRANVTDPRQKFGKEEAFVQAVRFFQNFA